MDDTTTTTATPASLDQLAPLVAVLGYDLDQLAHARWSSGESKVDDEGWTTLEVCPRALADQSDEAEHHYARFNVLTGALLCTECRTWATDATALARMLPILTSPVALAERELADALIDRAARPGPDAFRCHRAIRVTRISTATLTADQRPQPCRTKACPACGLYAYRRRFGQLWAQLDGQSVGRAVIPLGGWSSYRQRLAKAGITEYARIPLGDEAAVWAVIGPEASVPKPRKGSGAPPLPAVDPIYDRPGILAHKLGEDLRSWLATDGSGNLSTCAAWQPPTSAGGPDSHGQGGGQAAVSSTSEMVLSEDSVWLARHRFGAEVTTKGDSTTIKFPNAEAITAWRQAASTTAAAAAVAEAHSGMVDDCNLSGSGLFS